MSVLKLSQNFFVGFVNAILAFNIIFLWNIPLTTVSKCIFIIYVFIYKISSTCPQTELKDHQIVVDFLDQDYGYKSVATQIPSVLD